MERAKLRDWLLRCQIKPVVLEGIADCSALSWTVDGLPQLFGDLKVSCRMGQRDIKGLQWEGDCNEVRVTFSEILAWIHGVFPAALQPYSPATHWLYCDYKHLPDLEPRVIKDINWESFGFDDRDGRQSTFWFGTEGAFTPCHRDTYGCNLVLQVAGRKRWILWPPDSPGMYPTRIPYEESSIFSQVNVTRPDLEKHPDFKLTQPLVVTLKPGQTLFVPRHWWHYVENLENSISVNTWFPLDCDDECRLQESVTKLMLSLLMLDCSTVPIESWLNPTEELSSHEELVNYVKQSMSALSSKLPQPRICPLCHRQFFSAQFSATNNCLKYANPTVISSNTHGKRCYSPTEEQCSKRACHMRKSLSCPDNTKQQTSDISTDGVGFLHKSTVNLAGSDLQVMLGHQEKLDDKVTDIPPNSTTVVYGDDHTNIALIEQSKYCLENEDILFNVKRDGTTVLSNTCDIQANTFRKSESEEANNEFTKLIKCTCSIDDVVCSPAGTATLKEFTFEEYLNLLGVKNCTHKDEVDKSVVFDKYDPMMLVAKATSQPDVIELICGHLTKY